jgi:hypothetical protein
MYKIILEREGREIWRSANWRGTRSSYPGYRYEGVSKSCRTESITKWTTINTRWEATQRVMAAKLTRLTHKIAIQLHLVAESSTICSSRSRQPVRNLLDTSSYLWRVSWREQRLPQDLQGEGEGCRCRRRNVETWRCVSWLIAQLPYHFPPAIRATTLELMRTGADTEFLFIVGLWTYVGWI